MPKRIDNRRSDARHEIARMLSADVEFDTADGRRVTRPLQDISVAGLSFTIREATPGVEVGASLTNAVVVVGETRVEGNLAIQRVTRGFGSEYTCGAVFYPRSEADQNRLVSLVARIESAPRPD